MTILERYKELPEVGIPSDQVEDAHEAENRVARAIREYFDTRILMENKLRKDWKKEEIQAVGLTVPRNPRESLAEAVAAIESGNFSQEVFTVMRRCLRELDCTLEPLLRGLQEPE